jgi:uncharacterized SAM-binding protein YcdF (DUF218 family)
MSISPFVTDLVVPPLCLPFACLAGAAAGLYWRSGTLFAAIMAVLLIVLGMPAVGQTLIASLETDLPLSPEPADPPKAIVILSAEGTQGKGPHPYSVGPLTLERLLAGVQLWHRNGPLPILVTGGPTGPRGAPTLAARMAYVLTEDFAMPVVWQETASRNTWENAEFSARILKEKHIDSVYLVTNAWHMKRAMYCFHHFGIETTAAPVRLAEPDYSELGGFAPSINGWAASYYAFHEWIGRLYYAIRY